MSSIENTGSIAPGFSRNAGHAHLEDADKGKKQLAAEESQGKQTPEAVARVMWPAAEES